MMNLQTKEVTFALIVTMALAIIHHFILGNQPPYGIIIYFLILACLKLDNKNQP